MNIEVRMEAPIKELGLRAIMLFDMSFTLPMFRERQLHQALKSRNLGGYFSRVISVHPLAGLFEKGEKRFGAPSVTELGDGHWFVEGTVGISRLLAWLPPLNLLLAQINLFVFLHRLAREVRIDVIRIGDPYYLGIFGWLLSRLLGVPLVVRACFDYDLLYAASGKSVFPKLFRFRFIEKMIERFVFPRCHMVAGANQNNLDYAVANGALRERGVVFRYGNLIHPIHFSELETRGDVTPLLKELGLHSAFLMTVSRLEKMKQPEENLYVLRKLREAGHDVLILFVGDGSMRQELEVLAEKLGIFKHVRFAGNRSQEVIANLLPQARLVLSPHMGRALAEACLAGAPIVAYDYDWQGEIIRSGETGELVQNGNWQQMAERALWLLENPDEATRRGRAARHLALEMMSPEKLNRHEIEAYESLFRSRI
jgi:glycosyltransferase involved in cell wall biosynthesis